MIAGGAAYPDTAGIWHPWPARSAWVRDELAGVPIRRCGRCGVSSVATTWLCGWCGKARRAIAATTCRRGHPLVGANVRAWGGRRSCATCHREKHRRRRRRLREAA